MRKCTEKIKLLQDFFDIAEEEDWIFAFVTPFLLSEQQNMKMPITHKGNVIWRTFLQSSSGVSDVIHFWRSLPRQNFPEIRKYAQVIFRLEITFTRKKAFLSTKLIKSKAKWRLAYSNLKNYLLLSALRKQFTSKTWNNWWNRNQLRTKLIKNQVNVKFIRWFTRYSDCI